MTIVGFNFSSMNATREKNPVKELKIGTNIRLDKVEKTNLAFDEKRGTLKISFTYTINYDPGVGQIVLSGDVLTMQENKTVEALLKEWKEKKTVPPKFSRMIMQHLMQKCSVQGIIMSRDVGLPAPVPMPRFKTPTAVKKSATTPAPKPAATPAKKK